VGARHEHATSASTGSADADERHRPEETVLYTALQAHWKTFVSELEAVAEPPVLPAFVVGEVEAFLRCGILSQGLLPIESRAWYSGASRKAPRVDGAPRRLGG
jgi:hypothetical protein